MEEEEENILDLLSTDRTDVEFELCQKRSKLCNHLSDKTRKELWSFSNIICLFSLLFICCDRLRKTNNTVSSISTDFSFLGI